MLQQLPSLVVNAPYLGAIALWLPFAAAAMEAVVWRIERGVLRVEAAASDAGGPMPGGQEAACDALTRQLRLAEMAVRLADPRLARRPAERAAGEAGWSGSRAGRGGALERALRATEPPVAVYVYSHLRRF